MADKRERSARFVEEHHLLDLTRFVVMMLLYDRPDDVDAYCADLLTDLIEGRYKDEIPLYSKDEIEEMFKQYLLPKASTIDPKQARECLLSMGIPDYISNGFFEGEKPVEINDFVENAIEALHKRIEQWK